MDRITLQNEEVPTLCGLPTTSRHVRSHEEVSPKTVTTPVEIQYRLFMYSSTEPDTLRPVVRLDAFEHVVSPSRPEEQEVDYGVMARDYVKMVRWDYPQW
uniref:Uncharacterized protein n=1 Tax=Hyaloperonospora arabidopsidis (strain Emoy2) TaxID=559515 RepID=M4BB66_HYAAE